MPYYQSQHYYAENLVHKYGYEKFRCLIFSFTRLGEFDLEISHFPEGFYELRLTIQGILETYLIYPPVVAEQLQRYIDLFNINPTSPRYNAFVVALNYLED